MTPRADVLVERRALSPQSNLIVRRAKSPPLHRTAGGGTRGVISSDVTAQAPLVIGMTLRADVLVERRALARRAI